MIKNFDSFIALKFNNSHHPRTIKEKSPMVGVQDSKEAVVAVSGDGRVSKGFYVFRHITFRIPWLCQLAAIFYLPGFSYLGTRVNAWAARNPKLFDCGS